MNFGWPLPAGDWFVDGNDEIAQSFMVVRGDRYDGSDKAQGVE